jgi:hypothetical protein
VFGKNLSFGWLFALIALIFCNEKVTQKSMANFCCRILIFALRGVATSRRREVRSENAEKLRFYAVARCAAIKTGRLANRAIKENQWVRCFNEIPTREKWRICWVFSRARVRGIINDFRIALAKNPIINRGLTATGRAGRLERKVPLSGYRARKGYFTVPESFPNPV